MRKLRNSVLALFLFTAVCLPQATEIVTPEMRAVGEKLACKCGSCKKTVTSCEMLGCGYSSPAKQKIGSMLKDGKSPQQIVDAFVQETGLQALAAPPAEGFNLLAWIMPFAAIALGLAIIALWIKHFRKPQPAVAGSQPVVDERYRSRIEKELAELD
jgi:cytochrome c-type biogenesis protein CcmH